MDPGQTISHTPSDGDEQTLFMASMTEADRRAAERLLGRVERDGTRSSPLFEGRDRAAVVSALRIVAAQGARKHYFFGEFEPSSSWWSSISGMVGRELADMRLTFARRSRNGRTVTFTLEHTTSVRQVVDLPEIPGYQNVRGVRTREKIHRTTIIADTKTGLVLFNYPGLPHGATYDYGQLLTKCIDSARLLGLDVRPLAVRAAVSSLLTAKSPIAIPVRGNITTTNGSIRLKSGSDDIPVAKLLAQLVDPDNTPNIEQQITENIAISGMSSVALLWLEERVLTRVEFIDPGPDVLFVWGSITASHRIASRIGQVFFGMQQTMRDQSSSAVWTRVVAMRPGTLVSPTEFRSHFTVSRETIDAVLVEAIRQGLLSPRYRLRCSQSLRDEHDLPEWTSDPGQYARLWSFGAESVDGRDPKNIDVAFERFSGRDLASEAG